MLADALLLQAPADFETSESLARVLGHLESRPASVPAGWISGENLDEVEALNSGTATACPCARAS